MNTKTISDSQNLCADCGYNDCGKKLFLDSDNDNYIHYENLIPICEEAARDIGERYVEIWRLARDVIYADDHFRAVNNLFDFLTVRQARLQNSGPHPK